MRRRLGMLLVAALLVVGCRPSRGEVALAPLSAVEPRPTAYEPITFPRDEAPHDMLTEWWYYTGHLQATDGRRYGFEFVVFQTLRGEYPVVYLGQMAITDQTRGTFQHVNRMTQGSQIGPTDGLRLAVQDWRLEAALGHDRIQAQMNDYGLDLRLESQKPPVLHDDDGLVSFGLAGDSYYYSRTRLAVSGTLVDHGEPQAVSGQAWFDHQWGNFLVLGGGWDWFSLQLDDNSELMLNLLRNDQREVVGVWGTYVDPSGGYRPLRSGDFTIEPRGRWTSPHTGGEYPMGWQVRLRELGYDLQVMPVQVDQEMASDGNGPSYWEGASEVRGTIDGRAVGGLGYVELTGYAPR